MVHKHAPVQPNGFAPLQASGASVFYVSAAVLIPALLPRSQQTVTGRSGPPRPPGAARSGKLEAPGERSRRRAQRRLFPWRRCAPSAWRSGERGACWIQGGMVPTWTASEERLPNASVLLSLLWKVRGSDLGSYRQAVGLSLQNPCSRVLSESSAFCPAMFYCCWGSSEQAAVPTRNFRACFFCCAICAWYSYSF